MQRRGKTVLKLLIALSACVILAMSVIGIKAYASGSRAFSTLQDRPKRAILLMVSSVAYDTAGITWLPQSDAEGYEIYRSESSDESTYTKIAEVEGNVSYYEDTGLTVGTKYYYRVRAYKTVDGERTFGELSLDINSDITLSKPDKVKATSTSYQSLLVTWEAVDDAEGYIIYQSTVEDKNYEEIQRVEGHDNCQFSQSNLITGKKYYYRVEAYRQQDGRTLVSPRSDIAKGVPSVEAVKNVKVSSSSYNTATLQWDSAEGAHGYIVYRSLNKDKDYREVANVKGATKTTYQDKKLLTGKTYYYYIRAYRTVDKEDAQGFASKKVSVKPALDQVVFSENSAPAIEGNQLVWGEIDGADGYFVYRSDALDGKFEKIATVKKASDEEGQAAQEAKDAQEVPEDQYSYQDTEVENGTEYFYKVYAYRKVQKKNVKSKASEVITIKSLPAQTEVTDISCDSYVNLTVKFSVVDGADGYLLERSEKADGDFKEVTKITEWNEGDETLSYTDKALTENKAYYYRVTAYEVVGEEEIYAQASKIAKKKTQTIPVDTSSDSSSGSEVTYGSGLSATEEEINLMTALCEREAGTNYANCLAVANVVINRVKSAKYPNTIKGVIYQSGQFEGVNSGILNRYLSSPKTTCKKAVVDALSGKNNIGTRKSFRASWYYRSKGMNKSGAVTIGDNTFFSEG
jgi:spore germination cell wall hydrolase CwlJ-like protein